MSTNSFGTLNRRRILLFSVTGFTALLIFQLVQMQIIQRISYEEKSNENSVKSVYVDAPRGIFFDRNNEVIVSNKPTFSLQITPSEFDESLIPLIEGVFDLDSNYIENIFQTNRRFPKHLPRKIKRDIDFKSMAWLNENEEKLAGVTYVVDMQRDYSFGIKGSHIFGYTKEISSQDWRKKKDVYQIGDYVGHKGIEKTYEDYLRGERGIKYFLVDSRQRRIGSYLDGKNDKDFAKGKDLVLTIDKKTQIVAEESFIGKKGSLIALEPSTGEILAFVSAPFYNLEEFAAVTSQDVWNKLQSDPDKPLFNRAIMSRIPPGSTSKMLPAIIALQEKIVTQYSTYFCNAGVKFGNRFFRCHGGKHGNINILKAIEESCNSYFYRVIFDIGLDRWHDYAIKFGFGVKTGIDIENEVLGIVPSTDYYNNRFGERGWTKGVMMNLAIGQGEFNVTPIQLAQYVSLIANNGSTFSPHFVRGYVVSDKLVPLEFKKIETGIDKKNLELVKKGMYNVVWGDDGTAKNVRLKNIEIAGKTGTAQNPHGEDHALFVGFAPYDNPKIAVAVMVENVGFGSTHAAPIVKNVIKAYLEKVEIASQVEVKN
ncbi:MAG: penicillin-binding protein 2 [Melioribacteraceae bacterium]|nr:penicillin-binding protein 2 [Melioribacteraceae bacterium]